MFVCSSPQEALEEGETISTPTGPTTPGTPVDQIDTPPTIATPEDQDSPAQLPVDTPDEQPGETKQGKESDTEVGETEDLGKKEDEEGTTDSPEHAVRDMEEEKVAVDVQGGEDGKPEGDKEQPEGVQKVEDMPSFEEWKRQMLVKQQAELVEKTKHRE